MIVHLNGQLVPLEEAWISPLDRGFIFGDGVYEGLRGVGWASEAGRRVVGVNRHIARMRQGLGLARLAWDPSPLHQMSIDLLAANNMKDAFVYWQVSRGTPAPGEPPRSRVPGARTAPTVFGYCSPQPALGEFSEPPRKYAITTPDRRWQMGHLKSTSLMGNVLASLEADAARADDAIFIRDGLVSEGLATNVLVVDERGKIATPSLKSVSILAGVTRAILLEAVPEIEQRAVRKEELNGAREVLLCGTTTMVTSIVQLDGVTIGDGTPGRQGRRLLRALVEAIEAGRDEV